MQNNHLLSHVKPGGRTFSVLVTLLVTAMTLLPQSVWGQTEYGLTVGGVVVTSENAESITGGNIQGTVSFDVQTSALTLEGATITGNIVVTDLTRLTINVVGENTINAGAYSALQSNVATTSCALTFQRASDLDCSLALNSEGVTVISTGFSTPEYQALALVVDGVDENFDPDYYSKYGLVYYDSNTQSYPDVTSATITSYTTYDIIVNGEAVTNLNKNKIRKGAVGVGHITFDGEHTLTLNNVPNVVFDGQYPFIQTSMDLTIHLVGNNAFDCGQNVFITRMPGDNDTHTVTFTTDANNPGMLALTVGDQFDGFEKAFENNLQWCPDGYYDSQATYGPVAWVAQPFESYNLTVGGVTVTKANANKITGDYIQGTVSFNPSTNTLTLNDATISGTTISNGCIVSGLSSLNIVLKGNNTLDCSQDSCTAIRSVANAALTITKGEDECSLGFYGGRAIRDFKSVTLSGMVWDRTCAYQLATINNNGEHTGMMLYDTAAEEEIGEINLLDVENLPHPSMYAYYDPEQTATLFGFEADPSWEIRYSIDYVDESLGDVTNALYDMQQDENGVPLQGAATVTAWTVFGDATSDEVKGKLFELSETSLSTVNGAAPLSAPTLRPAIEPEDGISVSYTGTEQSDVATIDPTTGEVTILGLGNESFSVNIVIAQENGCTVLNEESLPFEVNVLNSYPLYIGDTQVTEINAEDVLGDGTVSFMKSEGQVAAATYTLTLNGAAITGPVKVGLSNLTFDIHGTNTITTDGTCIQNVAGSESMPSLTFKSTSDEVGSLTLTNNNGGISEIGQNNISVSNELAVFLTVNDTEDYTSNLYYMTDGSTTVAKFVPSYGVQIGEKQVYAGNAADVLGDGTISFNKETNTLTLNGANAGALCTSLEELTVELVGDNTLSEEGSYPVLRSLSGDAVTINVQSTVMGTLTMNMPYTKAGNFCEDQVTLNIVAPLEVVSGSLTGNDDNNNTVVIGPNYGITITTAGGSYPITSDNRLDVLGDGGSVQFDGKNTLILNNASISSVILGADDSWVKKGLTIYLTGENTIGEQNMDGLDYYGQGANVPLTFATGDVEPGTLTLSYSDQPLYCFNTTYQNNLIETLNPENHTMTIAVSMKPFVTQREKENTEDGNGDGLGEDIEGATTTQLTAGVLVNKILYTLPDEDDGYLPEDGKKVVEINSSMTDADANTIMAAVIAGTLLPGTPDFAAAFHGMTLLLPAGNGDIVLDVNTNQSGELHVMVGNNDPVVISGTTGFEERRVPYALTEASYVFIYNVTSAPSSSRRSAYHRAPGRKETTTVGIKGLSVSASDVSPAPGPALSPKKLDKSLLVKEGNHITVKDMDVEDIEVDAFDELVR